MCVLKLRRSEISTGLEILIAVTSIPKVRSQSSDVFLLSVFPTFDMNLDLYLHD